MHNERPLKGYEGNNSALAARAGQRNRGINRPRCIEKATLFRALRFRRRARVTALKQLFGNVEARI